MNIHLVIANDGEYSDRKTWVVQAFTDEAAAFAEAARLNAARPIIEELLKDYDERRWQLRIEAATKYETDAGLVRLFGRRHAPHPADRWNTVLQDDRDRINAEIESHIGPRPEDPADDYTVVSIPIGERGKWELP